MRCAKHKGCPRTTERKEETKKEAQDKMPAREPIRMRRAKTWDVEVENAYRFQCAGWRSAEEYAQGEYGDEISWFSDSGLVEKVQNRQGLFMYFKRLASVSAALRRLYDGFSATAWGAGARRRRRDGVEAAVVQTFRRYRAREPWGLPREPLAVRVARRHRECLDKYLPRVKIFEYANDGGHK